MTRQPFVHTCVQKLLYTVCRKETRHSPLFHAHGRSTSRPIHSTLPSGSARSWLETRLLFTRLRFPCRGFPRGLPNPPPVVLLRGMNTGALLLRVPEVLLSSTVEMSASFASCTVEEDEKDKKEEKEEKDEKDEDEENEEREEGEEHERMKRMKTETARGQKRGREK